MNKRLLVIILSIFSVIIWGMIVTMIYTNSKNSDNSATQVIKQKDDSNVDKVVKEGNSSNEEKTEETTNSKEEVKTLKNSIDYVEIENLVKKKILFRDLGENPQLVLILGYSPYVKQKMFNGFNVNYVPLNKTIDLFNELSKGTYSEKDVYKIIETTVKKDNQQFLEVDEFFSESYSKYFGDSIEEKSPVVFFKKDKILAMKMGGIGGIFPGEAAPRNQWIIKDDEIIVPIVNGAKGEKSLVVKENYKNYTGGVERSKYYS